MIRNRDEGDKAKARPIEVAGLVSLDRAGEFSTILRARKLRPRRASLNPDFRDKAVSLVHLPCRLCKSQDRTILSGSGSDKKARSCGNSVT
jgi:hypothetical protein